MQIKSRNIAAFKCIQVFKLSVTLSPEAFGMFQDLKALQTY